MRLRCGGFSLIELLIASTLIASAGALLAGGLATANRQADRRIAQALSTQAAASTLALLDDRVGSEAPSSGTLPPPLDGCRWTLEVTDPDPVLVPLAKIVLTVRGNGQTVSLTTYRQRSTTPLSGS